jgi:hypothetical protein
MNAKEELTKLIMESYEQGVEDTKQAAIEGIQKAILLEREECAKVCDSWSLRDSLAAEMAKEIRARGETK